MLDGLDSVAAGATFVGDWCRIHMQIELLLHPESEWHRSHHAEVATPVLDETGFFVKERLRNPPKRQTQPLTRTHMVHRSGTASPSCSANSILPSSAGPGRGAAQATSS